MAESIEITYACGHQATITIHGIRSERASQLFPYSQRLCPSCGRIQSEEDHEAEYIPPSIQRDGDTLIARRTWDTWPYFARRGWWLGDAGPEDRDLPGEHQKVYRIHLSAPSRMEAELEWLRKIHAHFPLFRTEAEDWELPTPRAFRGIELSWGLRNYVARAVADIRRALQRSKRGYIAFSGGKDSTALAALVFAARPTVPLIWSDDELEFPESVEFMERTKARYGDQFRSIAGISTHAGWFRTWSDQPYWRDPLPDAARTTMNMVEWALREGFDLTFLGLRGDESKVRARHLEAVGPIYERRSGLVCAPLWNWDADRVWEFIRALNLDYNRAYDRYAELELDPVLWRVGPLPLSPRDTLARGWPDLLARLEARYGKRWT